MREAVTADRLHRFMRELAHRSQASGRVYLTGGATAVLLEWRTSTVDVDITILPEDVAAMLTSGLVERHRLLELFERIVPELYRYPAIDEPAFRRAVVAAAPLQ